MARFLVTLEVESLPTAHVLREIRRADRDRAILFAEQWLARSRLSGRYFTVWYDMWRLSEVDADGSTVEIATGVNKDRPASKAEEASRAVARRRTIKPRGEIVSLRHERVRKAPKRRQGLADWVARQANSGQ